MASTQPKHVPVPGDSHATSQEHIEALPRADPSGALLEMSKADWTFLTNHGHVFAYVARHPQSTIREIAGAVGITDRATQKIIASLESDGYITRFKTGRCNRYEVHPELPMRHRMDRDHAVSNLLQALGCDPTPSED